MDRHKDFFIHHDISDPVDGDCASMSLGEGGWIMMPGSRPLGLIISPVWPGPVSLVILSRLFSHSCRCASARSSSSSQKLSFLYRFTTLKQRKSISSADSSCQDWEGAERGTYGERGRREQSSGSPRERQSKVAACGRAEFRSKVSVIAPCTRRCLSFAPCNSMHAGRLPLHLATTRRP